MQNSTEQLMNLQTKTNSPSSFTRLNILNTACQACISVELLYQLNLLCFARVRSNNLAKFTDNKSQTNLLECNCQWLEKAVPSFNFNICVVLFCISGSRKSAYLVNLVQALSIIKTKLVPYDTGSKSKPLVNLFAWNGYAITVLSKKVSILKQ